MNTIVLIHSSEPNGIPVLTESNHPLALPILGESFASYWLEYLASRGAREATLLTEENAAELAEVQVQAARWGLALEIVRGRLNPESSPSHRTGGESPETIELNHLPGQKSHLLFASYAAWFQAVHSWLPVVGAKKRIGMREIEPGVWVGQRARIARSATLRGPCWIGNHARIGAKSVVGPHAFLEDRVVLDQACEVTRSWVGPDSFLGSLTRVDHSLAWGSMLVNWQNGSHTFVLDSFLMCALADGTPRPPKTAPAPAKHMEPALTRPIGAVMSFAQKIQG